MFVYSKINVLTFIGIAITAAAAAAVLLRQQLQQLE